MQTETLAGSKRDARKVAKLNGHDLGQWRDASVLTIADCKRCGATAFVDRYRDTHEITGQAIDTKCEGDKLAATLRELLETRRIFTRTEYPGKSGVAYVRAYIADRDAFEEITWTIGRLLDVVISHDSGSGERYGVKRGGYGYNRALDVLDSVARACGAKLDQSRWTEI